MSGNDFYSGDIHAYCGTCGVHDPDCSCMSARFGWEVTCWQGSHRGGPLLSASGVKARGLHREEEWILSQRNKGPREITSHKVTGKVRYEDLAETA